jgi:hypothetical protein
MPEPESPSETARREAGDLLGRINQAWLEGRIDDLGPLFHPDLVMRYPGFAGRAEGREAMVAGFAAFHESARVRGFDPDEPQIDVVGETAVVSLGFVMVYEREGRSYRSTGRDLWVFAREDTRWLATWRTMLDLTDDPVES